jgi:hypothetical protein
MARILHLFIVTFITFRKNSISGQLIPKSFFEKNSENESPKNGTIRKCSSRVGFDNFLDYFGLSVTEIAITP